jgi:hypothetical protein
MRKCPPDLAVSSPQDLRQLFDGLGCEVTRMAEVSLGQVPALMDGATGYAIVLVTTNADQPDKH